MVDWFIGDWLVGGGWVGGLGDGEDGLVVE